MKSLPMSLVLVLLLASLTAGAAQASASVQARTVDARQLLGLAEAGLAGSLRAAQASQGRLDRSRPEQRPLWSALDKMDAALRRVRAGIHSGGEGFFRALEDGSVALGELRVVWARTGVPDAGVSEGIRILSGSYRLLRTGYGREAIRFRQGTGLTEAERQRFLRIQQAQQRFADLLRELQERAQKRGDEAMLAELRRMAEDARRIAAAELTLRAYLNALMIGDAQRGEWTGNNWYASPEDSSEWLEADAMVEELYVEEDVGHVFALDLGNLGNLQAPDPAYLEEPTELPESLTSAMEVYEAREVDPLEEEEALLDEEMEETADSDLEMYEVLEPEDEAVAEEETEADEEAEGVEAEDLPVQKDAAAAPSPAAEAASPKEEEKEKQKAPEPAKKTPGKKSAKPPA
jgi:hypothetical protein